MLSQCVGEVTGHTIEQCVWPVLCQCVGEVTVLQDIFFALTVLVCW